MEQKSEDSPEKSLNISNFDNDSKPSTNQDTNSCENKNININRRENDYSLEKISNLEFMNSSSVNNGDTLKKTKVACSPDDNLSSNNSFSGNEEDDNVEYKLIEKNLNNSLLNDDKFNLFFKKSLIDENLNQGRKDSFDADMVKDDDDQFEELKSVLLNEETHAIDTKKYNLIIDDDFDERMLNKLNTCSNNHDEDFIEEDIVPLNIKPQMSKKSIIKQTHEDNRPLIEVDSDNTQINAKNTICEENPTQTIRSNLCLTDEDDNEENLNNDDRTNAKLNEAKGGESELKAESLSSIEDNDLYENPKVSHLSDSLEQTTNNLIEIDSAFKQVNKAAFIWSETEAIIQQHEQTSASACGATAIINILKALNFNYDETTVCSNVKVNQRIPESLASETTLAKYLYSRSIAGMNSIELIENIENATQKKISGRFFSFYPQRDIDLTQWLIYWIHKGAVPSALLNLQKNPIWGFVPDAWHHQMIYACELDCVYLTNPLEIKTVDTIMKELTSESVLLVRTVDVIKRFNANNLNLVDLLKMENCSMKEKRRWFDLNVIGQSVNVLREANPSKLDEDSENDIIEKINEEINNQNELDQNQLDLINQQDLNTLVSSLRNTNQENHSTYISNLNQQNFQHIIQPASYRSGITLFAYKDSCLYNEIILANELPLLKQNNFKHK